MTKRPPPPPSLGSYRPHAAPDQARDLDPLLAPEWHNSETLPRIVTERSRRQPTKRRPPPPSPERDGWGGGKIVIALLLGLFACSAAAVLAAFFLVPTDLVRERLVAELKARTGRDVSISGRSSLVVFPEPRVVVRDVTVAGPAAMGRAPVAIIKEIELSVGLLPLLMHDVSIDRLVLHQPIFDLHVDTQGRRNWDFAYAGPVVPTVRYAQVGGPQGKDLPKELKDFVRGSSDPVALSKVGGVRLTDLTLGNVGIVDGTVHYHDERTRVEESITSLNAQFSLPNMAKPLAASADFVWRGEPVRFTSQLSPVRALIEHRPVQVDLSSTAAPLVASFSGTISTAAGMEAEGHLRAHADQLDKLGRWTGRAFASALPGGLDVDATVKQTATVVAVTDAKIGLGPLSATGTMSVETRASRSYVKGTVRFATLDLNVLPALFEAGPVTSVPTGVGGAATGSAPQSIEDLLKQSPTPSVIRPAGNPTKPQVRGYTHRDDWSDEPIDLTPLALADADLKVAFDSLVWHDAATGTGQISLVLKSSLARLTLDEMQLYDGRARGFVTIDATGKEATVSGNLQADGVSSLPLLKGLSGFDWLAGRARVSLALTGRGTTERQIVASLQGKSDIAVANGSLLGLNMTTIARNLAQGKRAAFERMPSERTEFTTMAASAQVADGIVRNADLRLVSQDVEASGAGSIDLPNRTMDYTLKPKVRALGGLEVPLRLTGSIEQPTVTPQLAGVQLDVNKAMEAVNAMAKTPAGKEVQDTVNGLIKGDPAARAKAKSFFDQILKN